MKAKLFSDCFQYITFIIVIMRQVIFCKSVSWQDWFIHADFLRKNLDPDI